MGIKVMHITADQTVMACVGSWFGYRLGQDTGQSTGSRGRPVTTLGDGVVPDQIGIYGEGANRVLHAFARLPGEEVVGVPQVQWKVRGHEGAKGKCLQPIDAIRPLLLANFARVFSDGLMSEPKNFFSIEEIFRFILEDDDLSQLLDCEAGEVDKDSMLGESLLDKSAAQAVEFLKRKGRLELMGPEGSSLLSQTAFRLLSAAETGGELDYTTVGRTAPIARSAPVVVVSRPVEHDEVPADSAQGESGAPIEIGEDDIGTAVGIPARPSSVSVKPVIRKPSHRRVPSNGHRPGPYGTWEPPEPAQPVEDEPIEQVEGPLTIGTGEVQLLGEDDGFELDVVWAEEGPSGEDIDTDGGVEAEMPTDGGGSDTDPGLGPGDPLSPEVLGVSSEAWVPHDENDDTDAGDGARTRDPGKS